MDDLAVGAALAPHAALARCGVAEGILFHAPWTVVWVDAEQAGAIKGPGAV